MSEPSARDARRQRNLSPWAHWMLRLAVLPPRPDPCPADAGVAELEAWRERFRYRIAGLLGPTPGPVPPDAEVLAVDDLGAYRRERLVFDSEETMSVPAYLLVPHDRAVPGTAVLAVHGHGPGKEEVCATAGPGNYAHELARRGHVVLAPDLRCFGERADEGPPDKYPCDLNLVHALVAGTNPLAQNLWDLARGLDVLAAHPLVDDARVGVAGFSYGGTMALFLAATDERVRAAVVSGYFSSLLDAHRVPWNLCGSQVLPGMLSELDHLDVAALVAPRALLVETGTSDVLFPLAAARRAFAALGRVYRAYDAGDRVEHAVFDGDHRWDGERAYPFLEAWL